MKIRIKYIIIWLFLIILTGAGIYLYYLSKEVLPNKMRAGVIEFVESATGQNASLKSVEITLAKGLVVKDLRIYDGADPVITIDEVSCTFFIWPFFKKEVFIPSIRIKSPVVMLKKKSDKTFNLAPLFARRKISLSSGYQVRVLKLGITQGVINFKDESVEPLFVKNITNLDMDFTFLVPLKIKFGARCDIIGEKTAKVNMTGEYFVSKDEINAKAIAQNISLDEFNVYYKDKGFSFPKSDLACMMSLALKDDVFNVAFDIKANQTVAEKDKIKASFNADIKYLIKYDVDYDELSASADALIYDMDITGLDFFNIKQVDDITGNIHLDKLGFYSDDLYFKIFDIEVNAKGACLGYTEPAYKMELSSDLHLGALAEILSSKFGIGLPGKYTGGGKLSITVNNENAKVNVKGSLDVSDAALFIKEGDLFFEKINGRLNFTPDKLAWPGISFTYKNIPYKISGALANFNAPRINLNLKAQDLSFETDFSVKQDLYDVSYFKGRYFNAWFDFKGQVESKNFSSAYAKLVGHIDVSMDELKTHFMKDYAKFINDAKLKGGLSINCSVKGDLKDLSRCDVDARIKSDDFSFYDLKADRADMRINFLRKYLDINEIRLSFYEGALVAKGGVDIGDASMPYWINFEADDISLYRIKNDLSGFKGANVYGKIKTEAKLSGNISDKSTINGHGKLAITQGKLWELQLFKDFGALIFPNRYTSIVFKEGMCTFMVNSQSIISEDIQLLSDSGNIYGTLKIDFDSTLKGSFKAELYEETQPQQAALGTALTKYTIVDVKGTLNAPKFITKPDVTEIVKDLLIN